MATNVPFLGRTWANLSDPRSLDVSISKEAMQSASVWSKCLASQLRRVPFLNFPSDCSEAAADAYADSTRAGIGGWVDTSGSQDSATFRWFQLDLRPELFPASWEMNANPQRNIAFYELIAQVALIYVRKESSLRLQLSLRHLCDNLGDVASANKLFSTKPPVRYALQLVSAYAIKYHCTLEVQHISGNLNDLADALSRSKDVSSYKLSPDLQVHFSVNDLLAPFFELLSNCEAVTPPTVLRQT